MNFAVDQAFPGPDHDHTDCVSAALDVAEQLCRNRGVRLTRLRRRVLELVWSSHKPVGAYALLGQLQENGSAAPPTVYRALDFLLEQGLIHRVSSLNAFVGCARPGQEHSGQFLICEQCHNLAELDDTEIATVIARSSRHRDFVPRLQTVEIFGLCPRCRE